MPTDKMASDNEACVSDPNFAIICSFFHKFGKICGIPHPNIQELQSMLENTQEVHPSLIDLHVKLLRKARKTVHTDKWERALVKFMHSYSSQDAWNLERFGYKKTKPTERLTILKNLLDLQFDANTKFKSIVTQSTATELRLEPIGRDRRGNAYWYQVDDDCNMRVYKEDLDEELWALVAQNREELNDLITKLDCNSDSNTNTISNEDSNSVATMSSLLTAKVNEDSKNENDDSKTVPTLDTDKSASLVNKASEDSEEFLSPDEEDDENYFNDQIVNDNAKDGVMQINQTSEDKMSSVENKTAEISSSQETEHGEENANEQESKSEILDTVNNKTEPDVTNKRKRVDETDDSANTEMTTDVEPNNKKLKIDEHNGDTDKNVTADDLEIGEAIEDPVLYVSGSGAGADCDAVNPGEVAEKTEQSSSSLGDSVKVGEVATSDTSNVNSDVKAHTSVDCGGDDVKTLNFDETKSDGFRKTNSTAEVCQSGEGKTVKELSLESKLEAHEQSSSQEDAESNPNADTSTPLMFFGQPGCLKLNPVMVKTPTHKSYFGFGVSTAAAATTVEQNPNEFTSNPDEKSEINSVSNHVEEKSQNQRSDCFNIEDVEKTQEKNSMHKDEQIASVSSDIESLDASVFDKTVEENSLTMNEKSPMNASDTVLYEVTNLNIVTPNASITSTNTSVLDEANASVDFSKDSKDSSSLVTDVTSVRNSKNSEASEEKTSVEVVEKTDKISNIVETVDVSQETGSQDSLKFPATETVKSSQTIEASGDESSEMVLNECSEVKSSEDAIKTVDSVQATGLSASDQIMVESSTSDLLIEKNTDVLSKFSVSEDLAEREIDVEASKTVTDSSENVDIGETSEIVPENTDNIRTNVPYTAFSVSVTSKNDQEENTSGEHSETAMSLDEEDEIFFERSGFDATDNAELEPSLQETRSSSEQVNDGETENISKKHRISDNESLYRNDSIKEIAVVESNIENPEMPTVLTNLPPKYDAQSPAMPTSENVSLVDNAEQRATENLTDKTEAVYLKPTETIDPIEIPSEQNNENAFSSSSREVDEWILKNSDGTGSSVKDDTDMKQVTVKPEAENASKSKSTEEEILLKVNTGLEIARDTSSKECRSDQSEKDITERTNSSKSHQENINATSATLDFVEANNVRGTEYNISILQKQECFGDDLTNTSPDDDNRTEKETEGCSKTTSDVSISCNDDTVNTGSDNEEHDPTPIAEKMEPLVNKSQSVSNETPIFAETQNAKDVLSDVITVRDELTVDDEDQGKSRDVEGLSTETKAEAVSKDDSLDFLNEPTTTKSTGKYSTSESVEESSEGVKNLSGKHDEPILKNIKNAVTVPKGQISSVTMVNGILDDTDYNDEIPSKLSANKDDIPSSNDVKAYHVETLTSKVGLTKSTIASCQVALKIEKSANLRDFEAPDAVLNKNDTPGALDSIHIDYRDAIDSPEVINSAESKDYNTIDQATESLSCENQSRDSEDETKIVPEEVLHSLVDNQNISIQKNVNCGEVSESEKSEMDIRKTSGDFAEYRRDLGNDNIVDEILLTSEKTDLIVVNTSEQKVLDDAQKKITKELVISATESILCKNKYPKSMDISNAKKSLLENLDSAEVKSNQSAAGETEALVIHLDKPPEVGTGTKAAEEEANKALVEEFAQAENSVKDEPKLERDSSHETKPTSSADSEEVIVFPVLIDEIKIGQSKQTEVILNKLEIKAEYTNTDISSVIEETFEKDVDFEVKYESNKVNTPVVDSEDISVKNEENKNLEVLDTKYTETATTAMTLERSVVSLDSKDEFLEAKDLVSKETESASLICEKSDIDLGGSKENFAEDLSAKKTDKDSKEYVNLDVKVDNLAEELVVKETLLLTKEPDICLPAKENLADNLIAKEMESMTAIDTKNNAHRDAKDQLNETTLKLVNLDGKENLPVATEMTQSAPATENSKKYIDLDAKGDNLSEDFQTKALEQLSSQEEEEEETSFESADVASDASDTPETNGGLLLLNRTEEEIQNSVLKNTIVENDITEVIDYSKDDEDNSIGGRDGSDAEFPEGNLSDGEEDNPLDDDNDDEADPLADPLAGTNDFEAAEDGKKNDSVDGEAEEDGATIRVKNVSVLKLFSKDGAGKGAAGGSASGRKRRMSDKNEDSLESPEATSEEECGGKRIKMRGRKVDAGSRQNVEQNKRKQTKSSSSSEPEEEAREDQPAASGGKRNKTNDPVKSEKSAEKHVEEEREEEEESKPEAKKPRKRTRKIMGLVVEECALITGRGGGDQDPNVRQSRRIAQLKIREEAERRKVEELTLTQLKEQQQHQIEKKKKRIGKNDEDKEYKVEKRKRKQKSDSSGSSDSDSGTDDDEDEAAGGDDASNQNENKKKKKKKRRRGRKRKQQSRTFDETRPWRSSSGSTSSSSSKEDDQEEDFGHYHSDEERTAILKSDHEFSPESDLEGDVQPTRRARTVKKADAEEEAEVDASDEHRCQQCGKSDKPEWILLCDACDHGYHCSCLKPMLLVIPEGDWYCPPCQQKRLIENLQTQLGEYDRMLNRKEAEDLRKQRLAYVGISLENVLADDPATAAAKTAAEGGVKKEGTEEYSDSSSSSEGSSGSTDSESDEDDGGYKLRERRVANVCYRFNDYDDLINSAIKDEMAVKGEELPVAGGGAGNMGRGKDISTIIGAEKEERKDAEIDQENKPFDVSKTDTTDGAIVGNVVIKPDVAKSGSDNDSGSEIDLDKKKTKKKKKKHSGAEDGSASSSSSGSSEDSEIGAGGRPPVVRRGRKKPRKLNALDVSSEEDHVSDEDFKGSSPDSDEEDLDSQSELSDSELDLPVRGRRGRGGGGATRRSTRARTTRYDRAFINDSDDDSSDAPKRKKKRARGILSDDEEESMTPTSSDDSDAGRWRGSGRKRAGGGAKKRRSGAQPQRRPPMPKKRNDSPSAAAAKKRKKKRTGELPDLLFRSGGIGKKLQEEGAGAAEEGQSEGRRTRGRKINYVEALASDSEDDKKKKKRSSSKRVISEDEYKPVEENPPESAIKPTEIKPGEINATNPGQTPLGHDKTLKPEQLVNADKPAEVTTTPPSKPGRKPGPKKQKTPSSQTMMPAKDGVVFPQQHKDLMGPGMPQMVVNQASGVVSVPGKPSQMTLDRLQNKVLMGSGGKAAFSAPPGTAQAHRRPMPTIRKPGSVSGRIPVPKMAKMMGAAGGSGDGGENEDDVEDEQEDEDEDEEEDESCDEEEEDEDEDEDDEQEDDDDEAGAAFAANEHCRPIAHPPPVGLHPHAGYNPHDPHQLPPHHPHHPAQHNPALPPPPPHHLGGQPQPPAEESEEVIARRMMEDPDYAASRLQQAAAQIARDKRKRAAEEKRREKEERKAERLRKKDEKQRQKEERAKEREEKKLAKQAAMAAMLASPAERKKPGRKPKALLLQQQQAAVEAAAAGAGDVSADANHPAAAPVGAVRPPPGQGPPYHHPGGLPLNPGAGGGKPSFALQQQQMMAAMMRGGGGGPAEGSGDLGGQRVTSPMVTAGPLSPGNTNSNTGSNLSNASSSATGGTSGMSPVPQSFGMSPGRHPMMNQRPPGHVAPPVGGVGGLTDFVGAASAGLGGAQTPKRRGRGRGKKTLAAVEAAQQQHHLSPHGGGGGMRRPPTATEDGGTRSPGNMGGLSVAAPPQPFSASQPAPSVITRMLHNPNGGGGISPGHHQQQHPQQQPPHTSGGAGVVGVSAGYQQPPPQPGGKYYPGGGDQHGHASAAAAMQQYHAAMQQQQQHRRHMTPQQFQQGHPMYRPPGPHMSPGGGYGHGPPPLRGMYRSPHHPHDPSPSGGGPINIAPPPQQAVPPPSTTMQQPSAGALPPVSTVAQQPPPALRSGTPPGGGKPRPPYDYPNQPPPVQRHPYQQYHPPYQHHQQGYVGQQQPPYQYDQGQQQQPLIRPPPSTTQSILAQTMQQHSMSGGGVVVAGAPPPTTIGGPPVVHPGAMPLSAVDDYDGHHHQQQQGVPVSVTEPGGVQVAPVSGQVEEHDEESGEFGGLVSYFSSQREDDLDT